MNYNDDNEYYRYTKLFRFKHPTIQDRYIRKQRHTKGNLFLLLPLFIFSLSLLPVTGNFFTHNITSLFIITNLCLYSTI